MGKDVDMASRFADVPLVLRFGVSRTTLGVQYRVARPRLIVLGNGTPELVRFSQKPCIGEGHGFHFAGRELFEWELRDKGDYFHGIWCGGRTSSKNVLLIRYGGTGFPKH